MPKMKKVRAVLKTTLIINWYYLTTYCWLAGNDLFPTTNFQAWFYETRYAWLGWRFVLYGVICL